jgi:hypothetical protein
MADQADLVAYEDINEAEQEHAVEEKETKK